MRFLPNSIALGMAPSDIVSLRIWFTANMPTNTGTSSNPSLRAVKPRVSRGCPVAGEIPGMEKRIPSTPARSERESDLPPMLAINTSAIITSEKYSKGPNLVDSCATGFESNTRNPQEIMPPMNEAITPRERARSGLPFFARG